MQNQPSESLITRLRTLIGSHCSLNGQTWQLIELLPAEGLLVLESRSGQPGIQADQYGRAHRRLNALMQIPIFDRADGSPSDPLCSVLEQLDTPATAQPASAGTLLC